MNAGHALALADNSLHEGRRHIATSDAVQDGADQAAAAPPSDASFEGREVDFHGP